jgi:hypothetical protein
MSGTALFLLLSNVEYVISIEFHHGTFIVITVDNDNQKQLHNIVINMEIPDAQLYIAGLLDTIQNMPCESIHVILRLI